MKGLKLRGGARSSVVRSEEYDSIFKLYQEPNLADAFKIFLQDVDKKS